jgi:DNA-binding GntR family transcriptional regulator
LLGGEAVSQAELARRLGISRGPVREALIELERDGLVVSEPYHKTKVAPFGTEDMEELAEIRTLLESYAVRRIVSHHYDVSSLRLILDQMIIIAPKNDRRDYISTEMSFHSTVIQIARSNHLISMWSRIITPFVRFLSSGVLFSDQIELHHKYIEALESGSIDIAINEVAQHIKEAYTEVLAANCQKQET